MNGDSITTVIDTSNSQLPSNNINRVVLNYNQNNQVAYCTNQGILLQEQGQQTLLDTSNSLLPSNHVSSFCYLNPAYNNSVKWVVSTDDKGFAIVDTANNWKVFNSTSQPLIGDSIYYVVPMSLFDMESGIMLSSSRGLFILENLDSTLTTISVIDTTNKYFDYDYVLKLCEGVGYEFATISKSKILIASQCWGSVKEKEGKSESLKTYFNNQTLNLEMPSSKAVDIVLYDMLGNIVWTKTNQTISGNTQYEINNLQSGIYVVNVKTKEGQLSKKLVYTRD